MSNCGESIRVVHPLFQEEGGGSTPTSPLQLHVGQIHVTQAIQLNSVWHSRLPDVIRGNIDRNKYSVCYGAEYGNKFYAIAIWSSPVARKLATKDEDWLELRRMAIADDAPRNTASRMISVMVRKIKITFPEIKRVISYQDTEVHHGTIYKASGWKAEATSKDADGWQSRNRRLNQATGQKIRWGLDL